MKKLDIIKEEAYKSIRYIIPLIFIFMGVLFLRNYSQITNFIGTNIQTISGVLTPLFIGFIIAYILNQPLRFLEKKLKLKRGINLAIIYGSLVILLVLCWLFLVPVIKSNAHDIYNYIPKGIEQIEGLINSISSSPTFSVESADAKMQIKDFINKVVIPFSAAIATVTRDFIIAIMGTVVSYAINITLGIIISVYLLLSKETAIESISIISRKLLGRYYEKVREFVNILDKNIGVYIVAKSMDSTVYAIICTIILTIVKAPYAILLGLIAGVTNMIPFFGPIIGTIVAVVISLFFSFDKAIVVLIVMIVVQQIESAVLEPYFVGKQVGVPPIFTILAVTLAGKYAGFLGILLAVPVTGVFLIYIKRFIEKEKLKYIQKD